jgi:Uma2 family endonuclease
MSAVTSPDVRFTAAEFERMWMAGLFGSRRVELVNGRIYRLAPQLDSHLYCISKHNRALSRVVPESETLAVPGTLRMNGDSLVDPDLLWIPSPIGTPSERWPSPILVVEVSFRTYRKDSGSKLRAYAKFGVRDYWIANLKADRIEVYRDPMNPTGNVDDCRYASVTHHARGDTIASLVRPEATFRVDDLLP